MDSIALAHVTGSIADSSLAHMLLLVAFGVHEHEIAAFAIEKLHLSLVYHGALHFFACPESAIQHCAGAGVLESGANKGVPFAGLDMLELHDLQKVAVNFQGHAVFQVVGCYRGHFKNLSSDDENFGSFGERTTGCFCDHYGVFNPHSPVFGKVDARLNGDDFALA